jgi:hypothetical protein
MSVFETLVQEYKANDNVAHLFGVVLYTDEHANIKKVLRDDDYWSAFNELTGDDFAVFSIRPKKGEHSVPKMPMGSMGMMVPIWIEPKENRKIIELFELEDTQRLPMLLLFTEVNDSYLSIKLPLKESSVETAYNAIKSQLEFSCRAIADVKKENFKNAEGLYAALSLRHDDRQKWSLLTRGIGVYKYLKDLVP